MPINVCLYNCSNCFAGFFSLSTMFADGNKTKTVTATQRGTHSPKHCCIVTSHVCIQILTSSKVAKAYFRRVCKFHPFDQRIHKKDVFRWESSKIVCNFLASQMHSTQISALYAACAREWFLLFFVESMHATATVCVSTLKFTFNYPQRLCLFFIQRPFPPPHWHRTHAFNRRIRRFRSVPEKSDWPMYHAPHLLMSPLLHIFGIFYSSNRFIYCLQCDIFSISLFQNFHRITSTNDKWLTHACVHMCISTSLWRIFSVHISATHVELLSLPLSLIEAIIIK